MPARARRLRSVTRSWPHGWRVRRAKCCAAAPRRSCARRTGGRDGAASVGGAAGRGEGRGGGGRERASRSARHPSSSCCRAGSESATSAKAAEARRRGERRVRTQTLDLALRLAELWLRDVLCMCEGAGELIYAVDRRSELEHDARERDGDGARVAGAWSSWRRRAWRCPLNVVRRAGAGGAGLPVAGALAR